MNRLSADEVRTIFLALEEYASTFALTMSQQDHDAARALAARIGNAQGLRLDD